MSVLKSNFDYSVNQHSPVFTEDVMLTIERGKNGETIEKMKIIDYDEVLKSNGTMDMWSLNSLLAAGVNPDFPIHTGNSTRLEGYSTLQDFVKEADSIVNDSKED